MRLTALIATVLLAALLSTPEISRAQEWTRFRGPNGTGLSDATGIPVKFAEADTNWRVAVPGIGHSQPVIWGDKIFLTTSVDDGKTLDLVCLSTRDGAMRWKRGVDNAPHRVHNRNSFASSTPALTADAVYVNICNPKKNEIVAWSHAGEELWRRTLGGFVASHGHAASPIVFEDLLIVSNEQGGRGTVDAGSCLLGLDLKTGEVRWKTPRTTARVSYCTPCVYETKGGTPRIVFNSIAHGITSVEARTGKPAWSNKCFSLRTVSSPVLAGDLVIGTCGSGGGGNYLVATRRGGKGDVAATHEAYRIRSAVGYVPTPLFKDGRLYVWADKGGVVSSYEAATGKKIWQQRLEGRPAFSGSPICVQNRMYCIDESGVVWVLAASDEFKVLARNSLGERSRGTPVISGGRMYLRTYGHLISIGGK